LTPNKPSCSALEKQMTTKLLFHPTHYTVCFQSLPLLFFNILQAVTRVEGNALILQNFTYTDVFSPLTHPLRKRNKNWPSKFKTHSPSKSNYLPFPTRSSTLEAFEEVDSLEPFFTQTKFFSELISTLCKVKYMYEYYDKLY